MLTSKQLALVDQYPPSIYTGVEDLKKLVETHYNRLQNNDFTAEHISIKGVSSRVFDMIESRRREFCVGLRFTHFADISTLIIKLVTELHEKAHLTLAEEVVLRRSNMNVQRAECQSLGSSRYRGVNASSKEGDSTFRNRLIRPNDGDWPSLVIEAGYSESFPKLRMDMEWWIGNSAGDVKIVLLIKVSPTVRRATIEKWVPRQPPRNSDGELVSVTQIDAINNPIIVNGAPLILEFDRVCLRPPNPPEADWVFTQQDLINYAMDLW
ncbi:hypothetical protein F5884DRAFT_749862 [Xylogone sp. PMI_703]|nr:hypothetical protein F5884DRAFT_749862 [Xylogone sp. PMI_703]